MTIDVTTERRGSTSSGATLLLFRIVVPGQPVSQPRPRFSSAGGFGRAYVPARHPIHGYREQVASAVSRAARARGHRRHDGYRPVSVSLEFVIARPRSHLLKSGGLSSGAPAGAWTPATGDLDNYAKGVCDAITDSVSLWLDDCQVVRTSSSKRYARSGETPVTVIVIEELDELEAGASALGG